MRLAWSLSVVVVAVVGAGLPVSLFRPIVSAEEDLVEFEEIVGLAVDGVVLVVTAAGSSVLDLDWPGRLLVRRFCYSSVGKFSSLGTSSPRKR